MEVLRPRIAYRHHPFNFTIIMDAEQLIGRGSIGKSAYYLKNALDRRIEVGELGEKVETSVVDDLVYLEKASP